MAKEITIDFLNKLRASSYSVSNHIFLLPGDDDYVKNNDEESAEEPEEEDGEEHESRGRPKRENVKTKRSVYVEQSESDELSDEFEERPVKKSKKAESGSEFDEEEEDFDELKREAKKFVKSKA